MRKVENTRYGNKSLYLMMYMISFGKKMFWVNSKEGNDTFFQLEEIYQKL